MLFFNVPVTYSCVQRLFNYLKGNKYDRVTFYKLKSHKLASDWKRFVSITALCWTINGSGHCWLCVDKISITFPSLTNRNLPLATTCFIHDACTVLIYIIFRTLVSFLDYMLPSVCLHDRTERWREDCQRKSPSCSGWIWGRGVTTGELQKYTNNFTGEKKHLTDVSRCS